jgi:photosystem II stability/assembly factor-like uncharacterized protein
MKKLIYAFLFVLISSPSYAQWISLQSGTIQNLNTIYFVNALTGIAAGNNGTIAATTNSGINWTIVSGIPTTQPINTMCFPTINTGYASGQTGYILKTATSGLTWYSVTSCGINVRSISFIDNSTGITGGGGTLMCFTTNGGTGWSPKNTPTPHAVTGLHFVNANLLMVCASDMPGAVIHKSTNSGTNFSTVMTMNNSGLNTTYYLNSIYFKDSFTGFATGSYTSLPGNYGTIYRSTNAGDNWSGGTVIGPDTGLTINAVHFGDINTGYAVGSKGKILKSTNAGANWFQLTSGTTAFLTGVCFINSMTGYVCGYGGLILKTTNGGITGFTPISKIIPDKFYLYQNYPNPFNPSTTIKYSVSKSLNVELIIYNILGEEVITLVNEKLTPGIYEVSWDAVDNPCGVYYYKLIAGNYSETKKMILMK